MDDGGRRVAEPDEKVTDRAVAVESGDEPHPVRGVVQVPTRVGMAERVELGGPVEPFPVDRGSELHRVAPVPLNLPA